MALTTPNFTYSQNYGTIKDFTIEDTSEGTDNALTGRLIYITKYNGSAVVPSGATTDYIFWDIADSTKIIEGVLDKDYALLITVKWFTGSTISYAKTIICLFRAYSELFLRQLTQAEAANRNLLNNKNFWYNKCKLRTKVDDAIQAVAVLNDQTIATFALNQAKELTDNPSTFY